MLTFSGIAAAAVWLAGRRDAARDPRLTTLCLVLLAVFPLLGAWLPKVPLLPATTVADGTGAAGVARLELLVWLWLLGSAVAGWRLMLAALEIARWRAGSELVVRVNGVEVRKLAGLGGPVAGGVWRRVVFVPAAWYEWPASERQMALDHQFQSLPG